MYTAPQYSYDLGAKMVSVSVWSQVYDLVIQKYQLVTIKIVNFKEIILDHFLAKWTEVSNYMLQYFFFFHKSNFRGNGHLYTRYNNISNTAVYEIFLNTFFNIKDNFSLAASFAWNCFLRANKAFLIKNLIRSENCN